ncbi:MAG: VPDSG-CTERM sorting domain-containing protein [Verrucomicrobiae bacterium]|nr:VPDSG-CTERM sorting domain-containing protein [Verrucomicrobiae bacterium]
MKNILKVVAVAAVAVALTQSVQAVPVVGNIGFSGAVQLNSSTVQTATEALAWNNTVVNATSGSFSSVANGAAVALASPWFFNSGALNNFWVVGGFTFNLASSAIYSQDSLFLNVVLAGTVTGNGFDATAFTGTFQVANPSADGHTTFTERLSFNSVPDGGTTVLLLGSALSGLALIRRKLSA